MNRQTRKVAFLPVFGVCLGAPLDPARGAVNAKALATLAGQALASIEEDEVIDNILARVDVRDPQPDTIERDACRHS